MDFAYSRRTSRNSNAKDSISTESSSNESSPLKDNCKRYIDFDGKIIKTIPEKHKTQLCKSFSELGCCRYGDKCRFAHGAQQLISSRIENGHYRQRKCKGYWEQSCCRYGLRCQFGHTQPLNWVDKLVLVVGQIYVNPSIPESKSKLLSALNL